MSEDLKYFGEWVDVRNDDLKYFGHWVEVRSDEEMTEATVYLNSWKKFFVRKLRKNEDDIIDCQFIHRPEWRNEMGSKLATLGIKFSIKTSIKTPSQDNSPDPAKDH